jgi:RNA polymerase sigma-70 factor, ECF subfamily
MHAVPLPQGGAHAGFRVRGRVVRESGGGRMTSSAIDRGKAGDVEGIRYLYVRYSDDVYGYVRSIVRDDHEAEDITQHVFAKLMTVLVKYDDRGIPFLAWLLRLARNVAIDHLRGSRAVPAAEIFGADERAEELVAERSRSLREALGTLPDEQRSVVVLRHVVGMSPGEIASRLGRSESSIHGLHHRGRRALQGELVRRDSAPCTLAVAA